MTFPFKSSETVKNEFNFFETQNIAIFSKIPLIHVKKLNEQNIEYDIHTSCKIRIFVIHFFNNVAMFQYIGKAVTNRNVVHE
jgi:hypothetical protein